MAMITLLLGLFLFLGIHSTSIFFPSIRQGMVEKSELGWKVLYSIISIIGIYFIGIGYAALRVEPILIYTTPFWFRHVTYLLMLPVMILFVVPYFPGKIKQITKHPQLIAVKLWAMSHLMVNGMLADVVLFGAFLAWAVLDRISMKKREQRPLPGLNVSGFNDIIAIVIGAVLTGVFIMYLHEKLIGMPLK